MKRFDGMTVLLTGATGGFGQRTAERFAEEGARLVLSDLDAETLETFASSLPCETVCLAGDISQEDLSRELVRLAVEHFGQLDVAVNNAGVAQSYVKLPNVPADEARRILEIDLLGVFFALSHQIPQMERQFRATGKTGTIVNMASVAGISGAPRLSVYSAAKHGVVGLTKSAALECAAKGVLINAVCPAFARTNMALDLLNLSPAGPEAAIEGLTRGVPMKRLAEVDEIVEVLLFAADPKNSFMTGQAIAADGGISAI